MNLTYTTNNPLVTGIVAIPVGTVTLQLVKFSQLHVKSGISLVSYKCREKCFRNSGILSYLFTNEIYCMLIS